MFEKELTKGRLYNLIIKYYCNINQIIYRSNDANEEWIVVRKYNGESIILEYPLIRNLIIRELIYKNKKDATS